MSSDKLKWSSIEAFGTREWKIRMKNHEKSYATYLKIIKLKFNLFI